MYDSNITLGSTGNAAAGARRRQDAFITLLRPGITVRHNGPWRFNLNYSMQNVFYAGDYSSSRINNYLQMSSHGELVKDAVFLSSTSTVGQYNSGLGGRYQLDNISRSGNTSDYQTLRISPYWTPHLGGYVEGMVRLDYSHVSTGGGGSSDSDIVGEYVNLYSGKEFNIIGWRANFLNQDNNRGGGNAVAGQGDITYRSYNAEIRYRWSEQLQPFIQAGNIQNDFGGHDDQNNNVTGARNGWYWNAGLIWVPSRKTFLQAGYGPNNYFASLRWNPTRRTDLTLTFRDSHVGGYTGNGYGYGSGGYGYGSGGYGGSSYGGGGFSSYGIGSGSGCASGMGGIGMGLWDMGTMGGMGNTGSVSNVVGGYPGTGGGGVGGLGGMSGGVNGFGSNVGQLGGFNAGTTWNASLCHRTRRTTWMAGYSEYITTIQQVLVNQPVSPDFIPIDQPNLTNEVVTRKRAQAAVNLRLPKTGLTLTGYWEDRHYQFTGSQDVLGVTAAWSWRFAPRTSSQLLFAWQTLDNRPVSQGKYTSDFIMISLGMYRSITPDVTGSLSFWHSEQNSDNSANTYSDNRIMANVFVRF